MIHSSKIICAMVFTLCAINTILAINPGDPNFELWNKTAGKIDVKLQYQHKDLGKKNLPYSIESGKKLSLRKLPIHQGMTIVITIGINEEEYKIPACDTCDYETMYLSYDHTGLRSQKGTWWGLLGTTNSGYDNRKNIDMIIDQKAIQK